MTVVHLQNLIGGRWRDGEGDLIRSENPARPVETIALGAARD